MCVCLSVPIPWQDIYTIFCMCVCIYMKQGKTGIIPSAYMCSFVLVYVSAISYSTMRDIRISAGVCRTCAESVYTHDKARHWQFPKHQPTCVYVSEYVCMHPCAYTSICMCICAYVSMYVHTPPSLLYV